MTNFVWTGNIKTSILHTHTRIERLQCIVRMGIMSNDLRTTSCLYVRLTCFIFFIVFFYDFQLGIWWFLILFPQNSPPRSGTIELVLIEARDLIAADLRGTSDPYVRVQYGNVKKRTKVCHYFSFDLYYYMNV